MLLDLSKLNNNIAKQEPEKQVLQAVSGGEYIEDTATESTAVLLDFEALESTRKLQIKAKGEQAKEAMYQQIFGTYQDNTRAAAEAKTAILKGLQTGEDIYSLFLQACTCISAMTGETVFKEKAEEYIKLVYGVALQNKAPLEMELQEVKERVLKICAAIDRETDNRAIDTLQSVLWEHIQRRDCLQEQLNSIK